jgi:hypothetical protein
MDLPSRPEVNTQLVAQKTDLGGSEKRINLVSNLLTPWGPHLTLSTKIYVEKTDTH